MLTTTFVRRTRLQYALHTGTQQAVYLPLVKINVQCTLVQALRLCTGCTAHKGSIGIPLLFHDHGTKRG
jgi:hypothetical protein